MPSRASNANPYQRPPMQQQPMRQQQQMMQQLMMQMQQPMMQQAPMMMIQQQTPARRNRNPNHSPAKLFIGGLPDMSTEELLAYFSEYGVVTDAIVMRDGMGKPRGFGFVTYEDVAVREHVLSLQHSLKDKPVELRPADGKR